LASDGDRYQTVVTRDAPPYGVTDDVKKPRLLFVSICGSSNRRTAITTHVGRVMADVLLEATQ
jgi:hypothetical protein